MANHTDPAHEVTERLIKKMERELAKEYRQAYKEVSEKLDDYLKRFDTKDRIWRGWVSEGKKTPEEYQKWRMGQLLVGERWSEMKTTLAQDLHNVNQIARSTVNGYMPEVYAINHNYATFEVEHGSNINTSYTLYDRMTVERIWKEHPDLMPGYSPNSAVARNIAAGRDIAWNKQQIQSAMVQGILQGESIDKMATRLQGVTTADYKAAVRYARTMSTSAQNAGRYAAYQRADEMGIDLTLVWAATLDDRTRISHRFLDSEERDVNEPFNVDGVDIYYPGDLGGADYKVPGYLIWNCRCTIVAQVKGFEYNIHGPRTDYSQITGDYDDWLEAHESTSNPIDLPRQKADAISGSYIRQYRGFPLTNDSQSSRNDGIIRYRLGEPVTPTEKTIDMALNRDIYVSTIVEKYGINLRGSGRDISIVIDDTLPCYGKTTEEEPTIIRLGPSAFISEEELANSIAHELNHCRSFLKGGDAPEDAGYAAGDAISEYIRGQR